MLIIDYIHSSKFKNTNVNLFGLITYGYSLIFFIIIDRSTIDSSANWTSGRYVFIVFIIFLGREDIYADKGISPTTDITPSVMLDIKTGYLQMSLFVIMNW